MEDIVNKSNENYEVWISFSTEKQKNRLEEIFQSLIKNQNTNNKLIFNAFLF